MVMQASDTKRTYIVLAALIDDFVIACADRATLDKFRGRFLDERTGDPFILACCEIEHDLLAGTTTKQYAEDIRRYPVHIRRLGLLSLSYGATSRTTFGGKLLGHSTRSPFPTTLPWLPTRHRWQSGLSRQCYKPGSGLCVL